MVARPIGARNALHVAGLYERIRTRELKLALSPDPRLHFVKDDPVAYEAALATAPTSSPTVLYQTDELLAYKPVRVPRWLLGGRVTCPEAKGWAPYENRQHQWFTLTADDVLTPRVGVATSWPQKPFKRRQSV
jgi:hypothetical protein